MMTTQLRIADIPRVKVGHTIDTQNKALSGMESERLELGRKASQLLGYRALSAAVLGSVEVPIEQIGDLGKALLAIEIETLDTAHVLRYQHYEAARLNEELTTALLHGNKLHNYLRWWTAAKWESTPLKDYSEPIPEFVVSKAVQIAEKFPKVEFYVQHLNQPKADPFLVATLDREVYYIEAWDEPRFEGRVSR
jgi:hypothetical protein